MYVDSKERFYATGKCKTSVARVWVKPGIGLFVINNRSLKEYFPSESVRISVLRSLSHLKLVDKFDVWCTVSGSGFSAQARSICYGISKGLLKMDSSLRSALKQEKFLTRDSRRVERKKPGRAKARKSFQFSKR